MSIEDVVFAQFSGPQRSENSLYIHPSGTQAIVIDGAPGAYRDAAEEFCYEWLKENEHSQPFEHNGLLRTLHESLKSMDLRASVAIVTQVDDKFQVTAVGSYFVVKVHPSHRALSIPIIGEREHLGSATPPPSKEGELQLDGNSAFILCTLELNRVKMRDSKITLDEVKRGDFGDRLSEFRLSGQWTALVFPIGGITNFENPDWPYHPFVGVPEESPHERLGLSRIADALFDAPDFYGFKILEAPHIITKNSSRMLDALLICPYGVFPIELKHLYGDVEIRLGERRDGLRRNLDGRPRRDDNPEMKLRENLRPFGNVPRGDPLQAIDRDDRRTGLLVFTNENCETTCVARNGRRYGLPHREGDVIICSPSNIVAAIFEIKQSQGRMGKIPELSTPERIDTLIGRLMHSVDDDETPQQPTDAFQIDFGNKLESESTDYFAVYSGTHEGDYIWVKEYKHTVLSGLSQEEEFARIGREVSILQRLNRRRIPGVRYVYGQETSANTLYVFLEPAHSLNLANWIRSDPPRADRLEMLRVIASILAFIGGLEEPVIHRAVNPRNIRVGEAGEYQLINFELSQRESLATLSLDARRTFYEMYQAPEVSQHGKQLTPAADVYSFMLCAYFTLAGELPFARSSIELSTLSKSNRRAFWPRQMEKLGLAQTESSLWMRALHVNARDRPTMNEIKDALETWS